MSWWGLGCAVRRLCREEGVIDRWECPIGRNGEVDTGKRYSQYYSKTGCDDKRRIVEIKRHFFATVGLVHNV
jgi:hypothetical protein